MIGKIIGAVVGSKAAQHTSKIGGSTGAALGVIAPAVLARLSIPAMIAVGAGGYFVKKYLDRQEAKKADPVRTPSKIEPSAA